MARKIIESLHLTKKGHRQTLTVFLSFSLLLILIITGMAVKNYSDSLELLSANIEARMMTMAIAARDIIDPVKVDGYNSLSSILKDKTYPADLRALRALKAELGADYLYVLKYIDGEYRLIYDTDEEDTELFAAYVPAQIFIDAFSGAPGASAYDAEDMYGSFSSGAVPLYHNGGVIAVVGADILDETIHDNRSAQLTNTVMLVSAIAVTLIVMAVLLNTLLRKIRAMQDQLYRQAHFDKLTSLPNRQYLFEYLDEIVKKPAEQPYALFFIDLDNFKKVNDTAGHDAGDALLRKIGEYLDKAHTDSTVFRPTAGALNVAARIGGDEFIIVAPGLGRAESEAFAQELLSGLSSVQDSNIEAFGVGFSIGIALFPEDSENYHVIIKYADIAMYHAKRSGKNRYMVYDIEMKAKDEK